MRILSPALADFLLAKGKNRHVLRTCGSAVRQRFIPHCQVSYVLYSRRFNIKYVALIVHIIIPLLHHFTIFGQENVQNMRR